MVVYDGTDRCKLHKDKDPIKRERKKKWSGPSRWAEDQGIWQGGAS